MLNFIRFAPQRILIFFLLHSIVLTAYLLTPSPIYFLLPVCLILWASIQFEKLAHRIFILASFYKYSIFSAWFLSIVFLLFEITPGTWLHLFTVMMLFMWTSFFSVKVLINAKKLELGLNKLHDKRVSFCYALYLYAFVHVSVFYAQPAEFVLFNAVFCLIVSTLTFYTYGLSKKVEARVKSSTRFINKIHKTESNKYLIVLLLRNQRHLDVTESFRTSLLLRALTKHIQWNKPKIPLKRELKLLKILINLQSQRLGLSTNIEVLDLFEGTSRQATVHTGLTVFCVAYIFVELLETQTAWPFLKIQGTKEYFKLIIHFNSITDEQFDRFKIFVCEVADNLCRYQSANIKLCLTKNEKETVLFFQ